MLRHLYPEEDVELIGKVKLGGDTKGKDGFSIIMVFTLLKSNYSVWLHKIKPFSARNEVLEPSPCLCLKLLGK